MCRHLDAVVDSRLDVPARHMMETREPFQGRLNPCTVDWVGESVDLVSNDGRPRKLRGDPTRTSPLTRWGLRTATSCAT